MDLLAVAQWAENSSLGLGIRESLWLFPVIEAAHLAAFAVLGGTILVVDLRLLGIAFRGQRIAELGRAVRSWMAGAMLVMLGTGSLLFLSEAVKCYYSGPFWIKMEALTLGVLFTLTVRPRVVYAAEGTVRPEWGRIAGGVSILIWAVVAWGGRWIGFSG